MESLAESVREQPAMPRFEDGSVNLRELMRRIAEDVVNAIMDAEADQLCAGGANSRNGYRERNLVTCVGDITMRIPKLRSGSFFPEDVVERYQRVDRAVVSAVAEMYATGASTRKVQRIAEKLGISRLSKDQVSAIAKDLDADVAELMGRDLADARTPYLWLDATYVKCRRDGRVASTAGALEAAAHEQRAGAREPRDKAPQPCGAGVPVGEVARAPGRGRDVRAGRAVVRFAVLRLRQDAGAVRREAEEEGARSARQARRRARRSGKEDDPREPGACGEGGCGIAWPLRFRVRKRAGAPSPPRFAVRSGCLQRRLARTAYTNILDTTSFLVPTRLF